MTEIEPFDPEQVLAAQARIMHTQIPQTQIGGAGVALCLAYLAQTYLPLVTVGIWIFLYASASAYRISSYFRLKRHITNDAAMVLWAKRMRVLLAATGVVWGLGLGWIGFYGDIVGVSLASAMLCGLIAGAVSSLATELRSFQAYVIPIAALFLCGLLTSPNQTPALIIAMLVLYVPVSLNFARTTYIATLEMIRTRLQNNELIVEMARQRDLLKSQNIEIKASVTVAQEANRARSVFLAAASHDLAQPLHSMRLFLLALEGEREEARRDELLLKAQQCSDALSELFMALLEVSKLDAGVVTFEPRVIDASELVEQVAATFAVEASEKHLQLHQKLVSAVVNTDPTILQRVLRNLLHNALKYTSEGSIDIVMSTVDGFLMIDITDTGPGIPAHEQEHVFKEFHQLGNPERDRSRGLGLGLAIVQRLSDLADYDVKLQSTPGEGSTFSIIMKAADGKIVSSVTLAPGTRDEGTPVIVFVDDEADTRLGMEYLLSSLGYDMVVGENYEEVMTALIARDITPDLIISDYRLREQTTGIQLITRMREEFNTDIPAFIVTGDTSAESLQDVSKNNIEVIHKLSPQSVLQEKIRSALDSID